MDQTLFYVFGIGLVLAALTVTAIGLRSERFPSSVLMPLGFLIFVALVAGTMTFAVLNARQDQKKRNAKLAAEAAAATPSLPKVSGPGGTLQLAASRTQLAFDKTKLQSKPGKVTIDFVNPSQVGHDVAIQSGTQPLVVSSLVSQGQTSVSAELPAGTYTFFCTVPGHEQAGMKGTLTVK